MRNKFEQVEDHLLYLLERQNIAKDEKMFKTLKQLRASAAKELKKALGHQGRLEPKKCLGEVVYGLSPTSKAR